MSHKDYLWFVIGKQVGYNLYYLFTELPIPMTKTSEVNTYALGGSKYREMMITNNDVSHATVENKNPPPKERSRCDTKNSSSTTSTSTQNQNPLINADTTTNNEVIKDKVNKTSTDAPVEKKTSIYSQNFYFVQLYCQKWCSWYYPGKQKFTSRRKATPWYEEFLLHYLYFHTKLKYTHLRRHNSKQWSHQRQC